MQLTLDDWVRLYQAGTAYQVFVNGKDVTRLCVFADDDAGVVHLIERDPVDRRVRVRKDGHPHTFQVTGTVELRKLTRDEWDRYFGEAP